MAMAKELLEIVAYNALFSYQQKFYTKYCY